MKRQLRLISTLLLTVLGVMTSMAQTVQEKELISTDFTNWNSVSSADAATVDVTTTASKENITFTLHQTKCDPNGTNAKFSGDYATGYLSGEKNKHATITTSSFASVTQVTFVHAATGSNRGWGLKVKGDGDADWVTLSTAVASPAGNCPVTVDVNRTNVQLQWYNLADAQNPYMLYLNIKGNVTITGEQYKVSVAANPAEGGTVSITPGGGEYSKGDKVTITAKPNFGYKFVNWTNSAGSQVSQELTKENEVVGNETYTANFEKLNTYELKTAVEGGANDYMVSLDPAPTVVDNKNMYEDGTKVTLTAASNRVLTFTNWSNGETASALSVDMTEDKSFTASYSAVDFIAGWDFYSTSSTGKPDFSGNADNEQDNFGLVNAAGETKSYYLRPYNNSYESHTCALNWNMIADKWYYQTKINAAEFKNIKIESIMMYNYNAYSVQKLEASLNGTDWETITTQDLGGTKNWQEVNGTLPAKYNNQAAIWLRWIPDYSSDIKGTTSNNDGTCITNIFILGDKELINDGQAPKLVSSVPANGATGASANGKIVLTFDEKVKMTDKAKATLGTQELVPTVSGKTVICEYKGLDYSKDYTFTLGGGSVSDLTDNVLADAIILTFQTKVKPVVTKALFDAVVSNAAELDSVITLVNKRADQTKRYRVFIKVGKYVLAGSGEDKTVTVTLADKVTTKQITYKNPTTYLTASNISFIGADYANLTITNKASEIETFEGQYGTACAAEGIGNGDVLSNAGTLNYFQGLTIKTSMGDARGRDIALNDKGSKTIFKNACLWGYQDTYVSNNQNGKFYFEGGVLRGRTDYLCGKGDVFYNNVTLQQCGTGGYLAVPSQAKNYGYVFNDCYIKKESEDVSFYLGRPWGSGTPIACFINTKMDQAPLGNGWADMSGGYPKRFAEYNSYLTNGSTLDLSGRRTSWTDASGVKHDNNPILTIDDVNSMSLANVMGQGDDWDPTAATEQASAPQNVALAGNSLSWDANNYVLGWVVFKNGKFAANVIEPLYTVDDATATWTVRAANEMGGLGEAATAVVVSGISELKVASAIGSGTRSKYVKNGQVFILKDGVKYNAVGAKVK